MAFSGMSSRERTIILVLTGIIVVVLIGIGILLAKVLVGDGEQAGGITPPAPTAAATPTLVPNPTLDEGVLELPEAAGGQPVPVVVEVSRSEILSAIIINQPLMGGRSYRVEIVTEDGSSIPIRGSWSQSARSAGGDLEMPLPEFFEGKTPYTMDLVPPVETPIRWSVSVSASPADLLDSPGRLVITIWDVTGLQ